MTLLLQRNHLRFPGTKLSPDKPSSTLAKLSNKKTQEGFDNYEVNRFVKQYLSEFSITSQ